MRTVAVFLAGVWAGARAQRFLTDLATLVDGMEARDEADRIGRQRR